MPDLETLARGQGYTWDEIDEHTGAATQEALRQGYTEDEISAHLGFDPAAVAQRAGMAWQETPGVPGNADEGALDIGAADWRGHYANALRNGEVRGSYDWADSVAAAGLDRMEIADPTTRDKALGWAARAGDQIAAGLPGRREFTDAALDVSGARPGDDAYETARQNLIDHWQDTGEGPVSAANRSRVNTELGDKLTAAPPQRGVLGEIGAGMARGAGSLVQGLREIGELGWKGVATLTGDKELGAWIENHAKGWAKDELVYRERFAQGDGIAAFVEGTIGEAIPTVAEYLTLGVPRMIAYGALHGAASAWERTGSATAAATGALIGGAEAGAPAPFLHGAAGQGLVKAAVKGGIGMGAIGGLTSLLDPIPDWVAGKGYELPTLEEAGKRAAAGGIVGLGLGAFAGAANPRVKLIDPEVGGESRVVGIDDPELQPTEHLHTFAADLAMKADQMERLRLENEGITQGNPTESGGFFQRKLAEMAAETGEKPIDPKQAHELAEGYRSAFSLRTVADHLFGDLWRDETGGMSLGNRTSMTDADRELLRGRADVVDRSIRLGEGFRDRYDTDVRKDLAPMFKLVEPHMGEWNEALDSKDLGAIRDSKIGQFIAHMQGVGGYELPADHPLRPFADLARLLNTSSRAWMENATARGNMGIGRWQDNYWPQLWKDPANAARKFGSALAAKNVPDFFEGIQEGLDPLYRHPIEHLIHDLTLKSAIWNRANIVGHLAGHYDVDAEGRPILDVAGAPKGRDPNAPVLFTREQPSGNMTPIPGMTRRGVWEENNTDPNSGKTYTKTVEGDLQAYASPELAKMISAWASRYDAPTGTENIATKLNRASNAMLAMKMMGPVYHLGATLNEMVAGGIGTMIRASGGDLTLADIGEANAKAAKLALQLHTTGLGTSRSTPDTLKLDPLMQTALEGGFRHGKRQGVYMPGREGPRIVEAIMNGSLGRQLKEEYEREGVKMIPYELGRTLTATSAPLFDHAIPLMKTITNLSKLELAMRADQTMSADARFRATRQIIDNTDHRLGEMNMNNLFWPRWVRSVLSAALISPSWTYGTVAYTMAAAGYRIGPKGLRGFEWNPEATANLVGLAVATAGTNAIAQWLWSGKLPGENAPATLKAFPEAVLRDLISPRTGGVTKGWEPARMQLPSQTKEYLDWAKIVQETYAGYKVQGGGTGYAAEKGLMQLAKYGLAKERPMWSAVLAVVSGQDAIGRDPALQPGGWGKFLEEQFLPIFATQASDYRPKSGIGRVGAALGIRETPDWISDQRRYWGIQQYLTTKKTRDQIRMKRKTDMYNQE